MRWAGHVQRMVETSGAFRGLMGKPDGNRPLGKPRRRWESNIKIDLRDVGWDGMVRIVLAQVNDGWQVLLMR